MSMFIDESKASGYRLAVTLIENTRIAAARRLLRQQVLPGQRRIHFAKESDRRRRAIVSAISDTNTVTHVYRVSDAPELEARRHCLTAAIEDHRLESVTSIIIEIDSSLVGHDRRVLAHALRRQRPGGGVTFRHERPEAEPLLWIPDAIAWCHARGSDWRHRIAPLISGTTEIRP